jgi:exodeoxyribonuclease V gamma subunit
MSLLTIVTGDSPNALLADMEARLAAAPLPPFEDERIVVQSLGMEKWVRQQLALRQGCAASLDLPFPAAFCRHLSEQLHRGAADGAWAPGIDARFEEQALIWRVFALLQQEALLAHEVFAPLRHYLHGADDAKRYGLAQRIAGRFDEYRLYRPELLIDWEADAAPRTANAHEGWQAALWRALLQGERPMHFARWFLQTIERLEQLASAPAGVPSRVSVFGVSTLPPLFVRLLRAVSRFVPVHVYVLAPDADSWRDGASRHPLFESFGQASRDLLATLTIPDAHGVRPPVMHVPSAAVPCDTLLHRLQHDLRAARAGAPFALAGTDRSLTVHVCYSPLREMEVLRDQLLDAFAADATLRPHDVLVMVPDVELYAPLAETIFGDARAARPRGEPDPDGSARVAIPYRVADRTLVREAAPARALLQCLALVNARCTASEVLGLLGAPVVRRAAGLTPSQLDQVAGWVQDAAIRWGYDGAARAAAFSLPAIDDNSWRQGLDRLLAGYATGRTTGLVAGMLPVAGDLVGDTELLGRFADWTDHLFTTLGTLRLERPLAQWSAVLLDVAGWLVKPDGADELAAYDRLLRDLARLGELADVRGAGAAPDTPVAFDVVHHWLNTTLGTDEHGNNFLAGGVTICAMKPMRAIPHRLIAMLGLDDTAYPRRTRRAAFDLIGSTPTLGDRDARIDDRQLVLDTIMSAGERLLLSYVGRSQKNNADIAPSIVIAELLDFLDGQCTPPAETVTRARRGPRETPVKARAYLQVEHRLQPFSAEYFRTDEARDARLFSFDAALARSVARTAQAVRATAPAFVVADGTVPVLTRPWQMVATATEREPLALTDLMDAWLNPSRFYCRRVLQLHVRSDDPVLEDAEPMHVDTLQGIRVQQEMLEQALAGQPLTAADRERVVAAGLLPSGALGPHWYDALQHEVTPLLARLGRPVFREPFAVDVTGPDWQLTGQLDHQRDGEQWRVRAATLKGKDKARAWMAHVVRNAGGAPVATRVFAKDEELLLDPLPDALPQLDLLVQGYRAARAAPLPYFLEAACAYRTALRKNDADPVAAAMKAYAADGSFGARGDICDDYVALLWRGRQPLQDSWETFRVCADAFWARFDQLTARAGT